MVVVELRAVALAMVDLLLAMVGLLLAAEVLLVVVEEEALLTTGALAEPLKVLLLVVALQHLVFTWFFPRYFSKTTSSPSMT